MPRVIHMAHRRTDSHENLLHGGPLAGVPPAAEGRDRDEPELLEILHKTGTLDLPAIGLSDVSPHVSHEPTSSCHGARAAAATSTASAGQAPPRPVPALAVSAFDRRFPRFVCCGCLSCALLLTVVIILLRLLSS